MLALWLNPTTHQATTPPPQLPPTLMPTTPSHKPHSPTIPPPDPIHRIDTHATILFDITEYYHLIPTPSYSSPTSSLAMTSQPALISSFRHSRCPFSAA